MRRTKLAPIVATGSAQAKAGGSADVRVRFTRRAAKRLATLHSVTLTVRVQGGPARTVTLKHRRNRVATRAEREGTDEP